MLNGDVGLGFLGQADFVTRLYGVGGHIDALVVHAHVAVQNELPGMRRRKGKAQAFHDVIESRFQHPQQIFTGETGRALGPLEIMVKLLFREAGDAFCFLLLAQTTAVLGHFNPLLHMHARGGLPRSFFKNAGVVALLAFQKEFGAFSAAQPANGSYISGHT